MKTSSLDKILPGSITGNGLKGIVFVSKRLSEFRYIFDI